MDTVDPAVLPDMPLPGHALAGANPQSAATTSLVIASVVHDDDIDPAMYLALLLNPHPPYYTVAHVRHGVAVALEHHDNIVPAVRAYEQEGGDY